MINGFEFCAADQQRVSAHFAYVYKGGGYPTHKKEDVSSLAHKGLLLPKVVTWAEPDENSQVAPGAQTDPRMVVLRDRLLAFGGSKVCMPEIEEDLSDILNHGQLWWGDRLQHKKGRPNRCHENAALCYSANKTRDAGDITIATGYALSKDGTWRQHSWCLLRKPRSVKVIETTTGRLLYYGFAMTEKRADRFVYDNT